MNLHDYYFTCKETQFDSTDYGNFASEYWLHSPIWKWFQKN